MHSLDLPTRCAVDRGEKISVTLTRPVRLLQLTDLHLFEDESREIYGVNTAESFRAALTKGLAEAPGPLDAILVTGDIAEDGQRATYERFRSIMSGLGVPVMCLPGNHEDLPTMCSVLDSPPLSCCSTTDLAGWRIVMLDSHLPGKDMGRLDDRELDRLDRELTAAAGRYVLVCLHHLPVPVGSPWLDAVGLQGADELHSLLGRHGNVRAVLSGHMHQAFDGHHGGIRMMSTPSTCAQFTPDTETCVMDLRPPGFRWLQLLPAGRIETGVAWLDELKKTARPPDSRQ
jgi:Icc protein